MRETKERTGFMSLWLEIRLHIYDLALRPEKEGNGGVDGYRAIFLGTWKTPPVMAGLSARMYGYKVTSRVQQPALTKLNRQLRSETLEIYYGSNNFVLEVGGGELRKGVVERKDGVAKRHRREERRIDLNKIAWQVRIGPFEWLQRIGPTNLAMMKNLDVIYDSLVGEQDTLCIHELMEYLMLLHAPLPKTARYLGVCILDLPKRPWKLRIWCPLNSSLQSNDSPPMLRYAEDGLVFSPVDRRNVPARELDIFDEDDVVQDNRAVEMGREDMLGFGEKSAFGQIQYL